MLRSPQRTFFRQFDASRCPASSLCRTSSSSTSRAARLPRLLNVIVPTSLAERTFRRVQRHRDRRVTSCDFLAVSSGRPHGNPSVSERGFSDVSNFIASHFAEAPQCRVQKLCLQSFSEPLPPRVSCHCAPCVSPRAYLDVSKIFGLLASGISASLR